MNVPRTRWCAALMIAWAPGAPAQGSAQERPTGLEFNGLPALNYDADEGFGYGVISELYHYGDGSAEPYLWTLQPLVFFTTEGRRDVTLFFDSPALLPGGWRFDAYAGREEQIANPYYGLGNDALYDDGLETDANPYYYRFGRTRWSGRVNLQRRIGDSSLRALVGVGVSRTSVVEVPEGEGTTLLAEELAGLTLPDAWWNHVRVGLVWDTRDRETGPTTGAWTEVIVQRVDEALGSRAGHTRVTFADRRYWSVRPGLVFANRVLLQDVSGDAPFYELQRVQTSFKQQEGLGGSNTVRGQLKNRFVGKGLALWNAEVRWRAAEARLLGRPLHFVLSTFFDAGRVWEGGIDGDSLFEGYHTGYGGGLRIGAGENFVVAFEGARSDETSLQIYIGVGYLF